MAKLLNYNHMLFIVVVFIVFGLQACAVPYDDTYILDCLATPPNAQYDGGMVVNPELNEGLMGWRMFGDARIDHVASEDGNTFIVASNRNLPYHSFAQTFYLEVGKIYTFSAWLQVSHGKAHVAALFKMETSYETAGWVMAKKSCWSMLKGGIVAKTSGPAHLYFETNNTYVDIWADSISLQSFTQEEWKSHQQERIQKVRKARVILQAVDQAGRAMPNATVSLTQSRQGFPLGCAINKNILNNPAYQSWFLSSRFTHTVFENELKWYSTEYAPGLEDYSTSDALMQFAQSHGLQVRGHNVFWNNPECQPGWVKGLSPNDLWAASNKRIHSVMSRYQGKLIQWDVVNENMHYNFFESQLGYDASTHFYRTANQIDPEATPFLNEFNTIECPGDPNSSPSKYMEKIQLLKNQGYNGALGIGVQGHFTQGNINLPYMRSSLEILAQTGLPIWATEVDVSAGPNQADGLGQVLQELYSHPAVQGIMIWGAWSQQGCYAMCLTDDNFNNIGTGNVVDTFVQQLKQADDDFDLPTTTDSNGFFETSLPHGEYEVFVSHPSRQFSSFRKIKVGSKKSMMPQFHLFTIINPEN